MRPTSFDPENPGLCNHCGMPRVVHMGFDHGKNKCLLAKNWIELRLRNLTDKQAKEIVRSVNAWLESQQDEEYAILELGSGI